MNMIKCKIDNKDVVMSKEDLGKWFIENSASDGTVEKTIILYDTVNNIKKGEFTMSDGNLNRLGMKVDQDGWDLTNYNANPVLLWNHDDSIPAIGNMHNVRVESGRLIGRPTYASKEVDEFAWSIGQKVEQGILTSGSVGFMTSKIEVEEKEDKLPVVISKEQELFEFSIVNLPALVSAVKHNAKSPETRAEDADVKAAAVAFIDHLSEPGGDYMVDEDDYMERLFVDREQEETPEIKGTSFFKEEESTLSIFNKNGE